MPSDVKLISVIVTTYNWPDALKLCLNSLFAQQDDHFEIIIADDGSNTTNWSANQDCCVNSPVPLQYVYHEDLGFRAGAIRNRAVALSKGEYLLFVDGDCVLPYDFINKHRRLAADGYFVAGNRVLLSKMFTQDVIEHQISLHKKTNYYFLWIRLEKKINRVMAFITLPLGFLRRLQPTKWQKAMTCNLALWKSDFINVNGFDEQFEGWGYEDSDLVIRLIHSGVKRKEGRFAAYVLHLWHRQNDRSQHDANYQRLLNRLSQVNLIRAEKGVSQYLE